MNDTTVHITQTVRGKTMKIVHISVVTNEEYETCDEYYVGVFDNDTVMNDAIDTVRHIYQNYLHNVKIDKVELNKNLITL